MIRYAACPRDCYDTCRLRIEFDGSKPTQVLGDNNFITRGITYPRAARELDHVYSSLRVLYPAINVEKSGVFRRLDWDEALDIVVSRLREVLEVHGSQHILFLDYAGNRGFDN